jgi:hypothetical protein
MSMMGDHNKAPVSDEVESDAEGSEETLPQTGPNPNSPNSHSAATVKLSLPPDFVPNSPDSYSAPTVTLSPLRCGTDHRDDAK